MKPTVAEALEALVKHFDTVYSHNAECCSRDSECDESDGDGSCCIHGEEGCPLCECDFTETQALVERARQALRSARYSLGSSS